MCPCVTCSEGETGSESDTSSTNATNTTDSSAANTTNTTSTAGKSKTAPKGTVVKVNLTVEVTVLDLAAPSPTSTALSIEK